ncbi:MAG: TOBE domain-containing protein [Firmicutes bacterium]|nr:TOBE domain-containing protein [Bacillota bacterium]
MRISARNQFSGKISKVTEGAVNGIVTLDVNGTPVTGTISMEAIKELGLKEGSEATAIIKATEVMIGMGEINISARNKLPGKIVSVTEGAVNAIVIMDVLGGNKLSSTVSLTAVKELGLKEGSDAVAVIKATSVMFGC